MEMALSKRLNNNKVVGRSGAHSTKVAAKEAAAYSALVYLAGQGYDVSYALCEYIDGKSFFNIMLTIIFLAGRMNGNWKS